MRKKIKLFGCFLLLLACESKTKDYYHGVALDEIGNPIEGVIISEVPITKYPQSTITFKDGSFKLYNSPSFSTNLIFSKKGYVTDTIETYIEFRVGDKIIFLNKEPDTLVLKKIQP